MCCPLPFPPPQAGEGAGGGSGRTRKARQNSTLRLSAFRLRFFLFVLSFVIAGLDPGIHAEASLAQRFHRRLRRLKLRMDHRIKSGGDESESVVTVASHSSDAKSHRENGILFSPLPVGERSRAQASG